MFNYSSLHFEEVKNQKAVSFVVNSAQPEKNSWNLGNDIDAELQKR